MEHSIVEYAFAGCCGLMAEMGNLLGMSYQKINVILFVFVEPILTAIMLLTLLYVLFRLPAAKAVWKVAKALMWSVGLGTLLLLIASAVKALCEWKTIISAPQSVLNLDEPNEWIRGVFQAVVDQLTNGGEQLCLSYSAINLLVYILAMPLIMFACYFIGNRITSRGLKSNRK